MKEEVDAANTKCSPSDDAIIIRMNNGPRCMTPASVCSWEARNGARSLFYRALCLFRSACYTQLFFFSLSGTRSFCSMLEYSVMKLNNSKFITICEHIVLENGCSCLALAKQSPTPHDNIFWFFLLFEWNKIPVTNRPFYLGLNTVPVY